MLDFDELRQKLDNADTEMKKNIGHLGTMKKDAERVSKIAGNPSIVINDIDRKFEQATKLSGIDVTFLFLAVALQVVRQYLVTNFKERKGHNEAAEDAKKTEEKVLGEETESEKEDRMNTTHSWYRPSIEEVTLNPVPLDQTMGLAGLGGAFEHRAKTPGHDAILGYIFGTANIATATLTPWHGILDDISFHIKYGEVGTQRKPMATNNAYTHLVFKYTFEKFKDKKEGLPIIAISLFREIMHLKSDINSKVSLPIPIITTISPDFAKKIAKYGFDLANLATVGKQAMYAGLINTIITMIHRLMYDYNGAGNISLYEVRTRKILSYSNIIASTSNFLFVAIMSAVGRVTKNLKTVKKALSYLDIGGLLVTVHRLISDTKFISQVKQEFLEKEFYNVVMGDDFDF
jgi:large-conductance mechanosensitive channel